MRPISCSLQLRLKSNDSTKMVIKRKWTFGYYLTQESVVFIQENVAFIQVLIYEDWHNQLLNTDKQITVNRLHSSGTFARTLNLRKPLGPII